MAAARGVHLQSALRKHFDERTALAIIGRDPPWFMVHVATLIVQSRRTLGGLLGCFCQRRPPDVAPSLAGMASMSLAQTSTLHLPRIFTGAPRPRAARVLTCCALPPRAGHRPPTALATIATRPKGRHSSYRAGYRATLVRRSDRLARIAGRF